MDKYTEILEFFMENGVQLTREQMEELKEEVLGEGALKKIVDTRMRKARELEDKARKLEDIGTKDRAEEAKELRRQAEKIYNDYPYDKKNFDKEYDKEAKRTNYKNTSTRYGYNDGRPYLKGKELHNTEELDDAYFTVKQDRNWINKIDKRRADNDKTLLGKIDNMKNSKSDKEEKRISEKEIKSNEDIIRNQKHALGQGMPAKEREAGTYLEKQKKINELKK